MEDTGAGDAKFKLKLTEKQIKKIFNETGIDLTDFGRVTLTAKDLTDLLRRHDPDKHDRTVGASV